MVFLWSFWLDSFYYRTFSSLIRNKIFWFCFAYILLQSNRLSQSSLECWLKNIHLKHLHIYIWGIGCVQFAVNVGVVSFFLSVKNICVVINYWKLQSSLLFKQLNTHTESRPCTTLSWLLILKEKINMTVPLCQ